MDIRIIEDPRKDDLKYDSQDWTLLLTALEHVDKHVAGILHGFRCGGLRLHRGGRGYALRPDFDPTTSIWADGDEYKADRDRWLVPHTETIVAALGALERNQQKYAGRRSA